MKYRSAISFFIIISVLLTLCGCSTKSGCTLTNSEMEEFAINTDVKDEMVVQYNTEGNEGIELDHDVTIKLYKAINTASFKKIDPDNKYYKEISECNYFMLWFYSDQSTFEGSAGCFTIYENDVIGYYFSPETSYVQYFKAPDGTYDSVLKIIQNQIG